jgi:hypothetical protein
MISLDMPFWGLPCGIVRFWRLRVARDFSKPKYYIGQLVVHVVKIHDTEYRIHVDVLGLAWTGMDWQYMIEMPEYHPFFRPNESDWHWVDDKELTLP